MRSLKFKFIACFVIFMILSFSVVVIVSSVGIKKTGESLASQQGIPAVKKAASIIDGDAFEEFLNGGTEDDPFYEETRLALLEIKETVGCEYLYTMAVKDSNTYYYVIDGSCDPSDEENFSALGDEEKIENLGDAPKRVLSGEELISTSGLIEQDAWGWQISTYHAIKNSRGKIIGFIGCDFNIEFIMTVLYAHIAQIIVVGIICTIISFVLVYLFTKEIFGGMKKVSVAMDEISQGTADLTARIPEKGNNELSHLASCCNKVIMTMANLISKLQTESDVLSQTGSQLSERMNENVSLINNVATSVDGISDYVNEETRSIEDVVKLMHQVENEINELDKKIGEQSTAIVSSSTAIEQISSNIESVGRSVGLITKEYETLVEDSIAGRKMQEEVSEQIENISRQSENLTEANAAIAAIAEQTNLLAMNAAIEAAHAGDLGKGFGVVADEIRSLAETSASQSAAIRELLENISGAISGIVTSSKKSAESFDTVGIKINALNNLIKEVQNGMTEQSHGVQDILNTMKTLDGTTKDIREASAHMSRESSNVFENVKSLESLANETQERSVEVTRSMVTMKDSADTALKANEKNQNATKVVLDMITGFKV